MYTVITRNQCNFCDTAKALLKGAGQGYTEYNVQSDSSKWVLTLMKQAGLKTVPQIFSSDGTHIGGYTELKQLIGNVEGSEV
ncbi:glutaredoxin [bacterium]|nr:glutaredoxin [bacterium]MDB4277892.1 glutaredoxin [Gammaproteobacteria bacterium]MDB4352798.1 glutaredoxin 3 [Porticoccaceae bacterium]